MSILQNHPHFYINSDKLIFQNKLFLNQLKITKKIKKTSTATTTKKDKNIILDSISNEDREEELLNNVNHIKELQTPIEIINNFNGEITEIKSFNKINRLHKKLLDNRFISLVLGKEFNNNGLLLTLTTKPLNNLDLEIQSLEEMSKKIIKLLRDNGIKFIKVYELTEDVIPHIHILILDNTIKIKIENILNKFDNRTLIQNIPSEDILKVAYYITKICNQKEKHLLYLSFEEQLKNNKVKLFTSSKSNIFNKSQRSPLFTAFLIYKQYTEELKKYDSENFLDFTFNNVKNIKTSHNNHLNDIIPHFTIDNDKIYHSTKLRVFSQYSRLEKNEIEKIKRTHKRIVEYSKILINNIKVIVKSIIYLNYTNNPYSYIFYYIVITIKIRIIIIKPPP